MKSLIQKYGKIMCVQGKTKKILFFLKVEPLIKKHFYYMKGKVDKKKPDLSGSTTYFFIQPR